MRNMIVILGPTASGKSSLSVRLAKKHGGVVISADSRQVYRGMNLGTAKITKREMDGVSHYLLDIASPKTTYSVAHYVRDVTRALKKLPADQPVFLVGGSPFYIDAITKPNSFSPVKPNKTLRRRLDQKTTPQLLALLKRKDPKRYKTIDRANRRRIIRAIEIASAPRDTKATMLPNMDILKLGLSVPHNKLYQQIDHRLDQRIQKGLATEIRRLHRAGLSWKRLDAFGLEYRWISRYLRKLITKDAAVARLKGDTHDFVRRQLTWWRRDKTIAWVKTPAQAERLVTGHLEPQGGERSVLKQRRT